MRQAAVTKDLDVRPESTREPSDEEFLEGLRARSPEAFETLMDRRQSLATWASLNLVEKEP